MNLVTLLEYKENQGISSTKEDVRIDSLITSVSQLVKTYCGQRIIDYYTDPITELHTILPGTYAIQLNEGPVVAITSVEERSFGGDYILLDETKGDYYLDAGTDMLYRAQATGYKNWAHGPGAVRIIYTGGYQETPEDLKLAIYDLITYYLKDEHKMRRSLSGASIDNQGTSSQSQNVGFPDHIKRVLDLYKVIL